MIGVFIDGVSDMYRIGHENKIGLRPPSYKQIPDLLVIFK